MSRLTRGLTAALLAMPMVAAPAVGSVLSSAPAAQAEANPPPGTDLKPGAGLEQLELLQANVGRRHR